MTNVTVARPWRICPRRARVLGRRSLPSWGPSKGKDMRGPLYHPGGGGRGRNRGPLLLHPQRPSTPTHTHSHLNLCDKTDNIENKGGKRNAHKYQRGGVGKKLRLILGAPHAQLDRPLSLGGVTGGEKHSIISARHTMASILVKGRGKVLERCSVPVGIGEASATRETIQ